MKKYHKHIGRMNKLSDYFLIYLSINVCVYMCNFNKGLMKTINVKVFLYNKILSHLRKYVRINIED